MNLDAMILRAIPRDLKCAITEQYNKTRRAWLKTQVELYIADELSKQFNAKSVSAEYQFRLGEDANGQGKCRKCKMIIVSDMWQLITFVDYEPIETRYKLCESCYEIMEKK